MEEKTTFRTDNLARRQRYVGIVDEIVRIIKKFLTKHLKQKRATRLETGKKNPIYYQKGKDSRLTVNVSLQKTIKQREWESSQERDLEWPCDEDKVGDFSNSLFNVYRSHIRLTSRSLKILKEKTPKMIFLNQTNQNILSAVSII